MWSIHLTSGLLNGTKQGGEHNQRFVTDFNCFNCPSPHLLPQPPTLQSLWALPSAVDSSEVPTMINAPAQITKREVPITQHLHSRLSKQRDSITYTQSSTAPGIVPAKPQNNPFCHQAKTLKTLSLALSASRVWACHLFPLLTCKALESYSAMGSSRSIITRAVEP